MLKPLTVWIIINCGKFLEMEIPDHLNCLLRNLHAGQETTVKTGHGTTDWSQIGKGKDQVDLPPKPKDFGSGSMGLPIQCKLAVQHQTGCHGAWGQGEPM